MNIDDFIFSDQAATPSATDSPAPSSKPAGAANGIAIKQRKESSANQPDQFVPQSVPEPSHQRTDNGEFGYVNRHHRKTSIDDRRVCFCQL